jgi:hypothetical protein
MHASPSRNTPPSLLNRAAARVRPVPQAVAKLREGEEMAVDPDDIIGYNVDTLRWLQSKAATKFNTTFAIDYVSQPGRGCGGAGPTTRRAAAVAQRHAQPTAQGQA